MLAQEATAASQGSGSHGVAGGTIANNIVGVRAVDIAKPCVEVPASHWALFFEVPGRCPAGAIPRTLRHLGVLSALDAKITKIVLCGVFGCCVCAKVQSDSDENTSEDLVLHERTLERILEQIVDILVPQVGAKRAVPWDMVPITSSQESGCTRSQVQGAKPAFLKC